MNPYRGEVPITLNGAEHKMRLTLGALVSIEGELGSLVELVERFEAGRPSAHDVLVLLYEALLAGGWSGDLDAFKTSEIAGGYLAAIQAAGLLLQRGFGPDV